MRLVLATHNRDKIKEIKAICQNPALKFITLEQVCPKLTISERGKTLSANARHKALIAMRATNLPSLAEDTGLEVFALGGSPGVYSARYAGKNAGYKDNIRKLLKMMAQLKGKQRRARFRSVFAFALPDKKVYLFEGTCYGTIATKPKGRKGFGYDPVFIPSGYKKTFGELSAQTKNRISHRAKALKKFKQFLKRIVRLRRTTRGVTRTK
uniref:dITP/XTP pyrophosphatase n=1 Tax=candidate division WOR-3 bacterium TaxID=2052148 RepID=A0A7C6EA75_UNCW3